MKLIVTFLGLQIAGEIWVSILEITVSVAFNFRILPSRAAAEEGGDGDWRAAFPQ